MAVRQLTHFRKLLFEKWMLVGSFVASASCNMIGYIWLLGKYELRFDWL